jgi:hypothetical protein
MMILSNAGTILVVIMNGKVLEEPEPRGIYIFITLQAIGGLFADLFFNLAHWDFAYNYY